MVHGHTGRLGQLLQGVTEVAVPVQAQAQKLRRRQGTVGGLLAGELPEQVPLQGLLQAAGVAQALQGVAQTLPGGAGIGPVLAVLLGEPLQPLGQGALGRGRVLPGTGGKLQHRIFQGQLLEIIGQLQAAHLQNFHRLPLLGRKSLGLLQNQILFHIILPPNSPWPRR